MSESSRRWPGSSTQAAGGPSCEHGCFQEERGFAHTLAWSFRRCRKFPDSLRAAVGVSWWRPPTVFTRGLAGRRVENVGKRERREESEGGQQRGRGGASARALTFLSVPRRSRARPLNRRKMAKICRGHRLSMGAAGLTLLVIAILTIPFQPTLERKGFGQMTAWFRLTVVVIGITMIGIEFLR